MMWYVAQSLVLLKLYIRGWRSERGYTFLQADYGSDRKSVTLQVVMRAPD